MATLADEAARLLPEPPAGHDAFGYLAWEELVLSTARRLAQFGEFPEHGAGRVALGTRSHRLDGTSLLSLASLLVGHADATVAEESLSQAVIRSEQVPWGTRVSRTFGTKAPASRRPLRRRTMLVPLRVI
jgi:hypothetical protein